MFKQLSKLKERPLPGRPAQANRYEYSPLNERLGEIRIMTLLSGKFRDPIRILIQTFIMNYDIQPDFEALSYTWGSAEDMHHIYVGEVGSVTLPVTQNLAVALPYLRYADRPRNLWIDAICVNQSDLSERSSQVKKMVRSQNCQCPLRINFQNSFGVPVVSNIVY